MTIENEAEKLLNELDDAIDIMTIARSQNSLIFIKGVVRYIKSMAPHDVRRTFEEVKRS